MTDNKKLPRRSSNDRNPLPTNSKERDDGLDEIDSMFSEKKRKTKEQVRNNNYTRSSPGNNKKRKNQLGGSEIKKDPTGKNREWVDDGLGGKYNSEGYTGRVEDGMKIFKAHVLNKPNAGSTKDCPFDCDCCYI